MKFELIFTYSLFILIAKLNYLIDNKYSLIEINF